MSVTHVVVAPPGSTVLEVHEVPVPDPGPHQVVVRQIAAGVCHSQLHQLRRPRQGPLLLGHESSGVVTAVGSAVRHVREGDSVVLTWVPRCAEAAARRPEPARLALADGSEAVSPQGIFTWADVTIADEQFVVRVPDDTPMVEASILGCAVMTGAGAVRNTAGVKRGDSVAVIGAGGVGLSAIAAARAVGAEPIIAVDLSDAKLAFAKAFGATHLVNAGRDDAVEAIRSITGDADGRTYNGDEVRGVDFAFDCIGVASTMAQALAAARGSPFGGEVGGTAVIVGAGAVAFELDARDVLVNQKKLVGCLGGSSSPERDFPLLLEWSSGGQLDLGRLVTDRFKLAEINTAVDALERGAVGGRAVLTF